MQNTSFHVNATTYIWEPWIALVNAGLGLTYSSTDIEDTEQEGEIVTGDGRIQLFPRSYFPFELFAEVRDSRVDGELAGNDFSSETYGFNQQYAPKAGTRLGLHYEHSEREEIREFVINPTDENSSQQDLLRFNLNRSIGNHSFNFDSKWEETDRDQNELNDNRSLQILRHRYRPDTSLSIDNLLSITKNELSSSTSISENRRAQLNINTFWRPNVKRPLTVTATGLLVESDNTSNGQESNSTTNSIFTGGVNYQWTPQLSIRSSASVSQTEINATDKTSSLVKLGSTYTGELKRIGELNYRWSILADISNRTGNEETDDNSVQEYSLGISHGINRIHPIYRGLLQFNFNQQAFITDNTIEHEEHVLTHSGSLGWTHRGGKSSTILQVSASDRRRIDGVENIYQLINLQASRTHQLSRVSSWSGNITIQSTRIKNELQDTDWQTTANIDLSYQRQQVFNIPRLRFLTEYRFLSEELAMAVQDNNIIDEHDTNYWKNRLEYNIGRLQLSLHANITDRDGQQYKLMMFNLRRNFGGNSH